jgi:uncharacterized protein YjdB
LGWTVDALDLQDPTSPVFLADPEIEMRVGQTLRLTVRTVAFGCVVPPKTVSYSSSNPEIARAFESDSSWDLEGIAPGTTVITARIRGEDGQGATASKLFRVL